MSTPTGTVASPRPSHSGEVARAEAIARVAGLSPRDRVLLALRLGRRADFLGAWREEDGKDER